MRFRVEERVVTYTTKVPMLDFSTEILRGAALMDTKFGMDWDKQIKTKELDLMDGDRCVLGQVFVEKFVGDIVRHYDDHYNGGVNYLFGGSNKKASRYGFFVNHDSKAYQQWAAKYAEYIGLKNYVESSGTTEDLYFPEEHLDGDELANWRKVNKHAWEILTAQWIDYIKERREMRRLIAEEAQKISTMIEQDGSAIRAALEVPEQKKVEV